MVTYSYPYFSALWWHCARVWSFSWWRLYRHNMLPRHPRRWHTLCILSGFVEYTSHFRAILRFSPPSLPKHLDSKMWQWISVLFSHLRCHVMFVNLFVLNCSSSKSLVCLILAACNCWLGILLPDSHRYCWRFAIYVIGSDCRLVRYVRHCFGFLSNRWVRQYMLIFHQNSLASWGLVQYFEDLISGIWNNLIAIGIHQPAINGLAMHAFSF